jgi:hypothetical protein
MITKGIPAIGVGAFIVAVILAGWSGPDDSGGVGSAPDATSAPATIEYRGLAIPTQSGYKPLETFTPLLQEIAAMGANTVLFSTPGFMEHAESQNIFIEARKTPAPEQFVELIRRARQLDLRVIVMPIVLLTHPRGSEWRGVIKPPDWDEWWRQYRELVAYVANIARDGGAEVMVVGSELVSTEKYTDQWVRTIAKVREHFPQGKLGYSANWDHYKPVKFWDQLDFVGMTTYHKLAEGKQPTVEEIVAHWRPIHREVMAWQRRIGKPLLFTEVGWCSQEGAAMAPWNYYQNTQATAAGHEEQRRLYEAFLQVWGDTPGLAGVIWWEWTGDPGGPGDYNYTPKNKPAQQVLERWFAGSRRGRADEALPDSP